jgi:thioredoxin-like negative regulator of GroEL
VAARITELLDKVPGDDDARQEIVDLIETMELDDPRRAQYRRALTSKLF